MKVRKVLPPAAIEEKVAVARSRQSMRPGADGVLCGTKICCTRYGNVMCSRGSVIPLWIDQIRGGNPITVTDPRMLNLEETIEKIASLEYIQEELRRTL